MSRCIISLLIWQNRPSGIPDLCWEMKIIYRRSRFSRSFVSWSEVTTAEATLRADSICNNPIPEWQFRIGIRGSFYERCDAVCTTVFGIDFFARIFGPTRAWSRTWHEVVTCMSSRQRRWLDDSIPSARLFRIQIRNPSKCRITFLFRFTLNMANRTCILNPDYHSGLV